MNSDDEAPLLRSNNNDYGSSINDEMKETSEPLLEGKPACNKLQYITVEPMFCSSAFIIVLYSVLAKEYIYERLSVEQGLVVNHTDHPCNSSIKVNESDPDYILEGKISAETSKWTLFFYLAGFIPAMFTTMMFGAWSDRVGRKIPMVISSTGLFLLTVVYALVVQFNLPLPVLIIGHLVCGLSGDYSTILSQGFAYISDITTDARRTFRLAVAGAVLELGAMVASLTSGFWVRNGGFVAPYWFLVVLAFCNIAYIILRLRSPDKGGLWKNLRYLVNCKSFAQIWSLLKKTEDNSNRNVSLILYSICFFIATSVMVGARGVLIVYEVGVPFCWNFVYTGLSLALLQFGNLPCLVLLKVFKGLTAELWLNVAGIVSNILSYTIIALARTNWLLFVGIVVQWFTYAIAPILRSQTARLAGPNEVGGVFSLLACVQNAAALISTTLYNGLFIASVKTSLPGSVFFVSVVFYVIYAAIYGVVFRISKDSLQYNDGAEQNRDIVQDG